MDYVTPGLGAVSFLAPSREQGIKFDLILNTELFYMNLFTYQSTVDIDGNITTAILLHAIYFEHLDRHAKDLAAIISNQSFYFECLGKLTHAFLKGLSCIIFIEEFDVKEVHIIESINVWRSGNGLIVDSESRQSIWNFGTKSDQDNWETQLLLVQQSLQKPRIPPKVQNTLYHSPPVTPTRDDQDSLPVIPVSSPFPPRFGFTSWKNNLSWLSFKHKKKSKKEASILYEEKSEEKQEQKLSTQVQRTRANRKVTQEQSDDQGSTDDSSDTDEVVEIVVKNDSGASVQPADERLSLDFLDFEDQPDIFSDFKKLL
jgi:hypothetical protein